VPSEGGQSRLKGPVKAICEVPSIGGISHAAEENTSDDQLVAGIEAYGLLAGRVLSEAR
jgi:acetylornithine deacetylase/succinyl-diaminopimelate desuccinylase-like protein